MSKYVPDDDLPPTTARILANRALSRTCGQECVDWALNLLEQGHDGMALCVLACMHPPHNHFELAELRDTALADLKLAEIQPPQALNLYAVEIMKSALSDKIDSLRALQALRDIYCEDDCQQNLHDFYLLYHAYTDLQEYEEQYYWDDATSENIDSLVKQHFESFIKNRDIYTETT